MFGKGQRVYSFVFFQFQTQFFAKAFTPYRPGPAKGAHRAKRCANNDSGALKAQGDASGRERAQTDGSLVRGGLCFFVFFGIRWKFLYQFHRFRTTESCLAATPDRIVEVVPLATRFQRRLYILSVDFQFHLQRKTVGIKQVAILIFHRNCQTVQMLVPAVYVT